jgi:hypothetical protein
MTRIASHGEGLECQLKVPDDRVVDQLQAGGVDLGRHVGGLSDTRAARPARD